MSLNVVSLQTIGLRSLEELDCSNNTLLELPPKMEHMKNLRVLDCSHNRLKYLPDCIGRFPTRTQSCTCILLTE